jgi:ubiquitin C-terminal hydrolase|tara:strand:- start:85798 stop:86766 length:969 start_codon:yes stop_codon:yes gene_type:complete
MDTATTRRIEDLEAAKPATRAITYSKYDKFNVSPQFGFHNSGVICWFNSIMQFMLSLSSFNEAMMENDSQSAFGIKYRELVSKLLPHDPDHPADCRWASDYSSILLRELVTSITRANRSTLLGMGQQCADEGFTEIVDAVGLQVVEKLFVNVYENKIICPVCKKVVSTVRDNSVRIGMPITDIKDAARFQNWLCNHVTYVDFKCPECNVSSQKVKRAEQLKSLREVIVIVFDMFDRSFGSSIWYPQELNFPVVKELGGGFLKYELCAKVEWSGSTHPSGNSSGHYWSTCKRGDKWYCLNDTSVSAGNPNPTPSTYMVAYHMV